MLSSDRERVDPRGGGDKLIARRIIKGALTARDKSVGHLVRKSSTQCRQSLEKPKRKSNEQYVVVEDLLWGWGGGGNTGSSAIIQFLYFTSTCLKSVYY
jgi:hypothetical protein